ncbi:MAG: FAD-dependent oxidoreductase [Deltaproteobacteria bacterium]
MRHIVIIGNSAAGMAAAEAVRGRDREARLTILTDEPFPAYERYRVLDFFEGRCKERDLVFRDKGFYADHGIALLADKKVTGISVHRRHVHLKDKETVDFDDLVIASGRRPALPALKGIQKEGVLSFGGLREAKILLDNLPIAHTVLIVGETPVALELARGLAVRKVDVKLFGAPETAPDGVEVIRDNPLIEILGDSELKAVRLANHKVIGASLLVFAGPREPNVDFLRDTDIKINRGVLVDPSFRTSVPYVYAVGDAAEPREGAWSQGWQEARRQGEMLGGLLCQA